MPFSDFRLMAVALLVIAGCALATTLRSFGFTRWFPPKVRRLVQKFHAKLKRKDAALGGMELTWEHLVNEARNELTPAHRPKRKRRPKKDT
jgi:Na+/H+ antiporter NhaB